MSDYKCCKDCSQEFPATPEYFPLEKRNSDGLQTWCRQCDRIRRKQWRDAHPDLVAAQKKRGHALHREQDNARSSTWYYDNLDYSKQQKHEYYLAHRQEFLDRAKKRYANKSIEIKAYISHWQCNNRDKTRKYAFDRRRKQGMNVRAPAYFHTERRRVRKQLRRARMMGLEATLTFSEWEHCIDYFNNCCAMCGRPKGFFHTIGLDHWIPLERGGGTTADNVLPMCCGYDGCNNEKSDRDPHTWLTTRFGARRAAAIEARIAAYFDSVTE